MRREDASGHLAAIVTILIWGTTFISTKILLRDLRPVEILFARFVLGFFALAAVFPHRMKVTERRQELYFALAGLCGVCLYYLLENMALIETQASNVGVIISIAPFFTAIVTQITARGEERMCPTFFIGFAAAMTGIGLISFNGAGLEVNPQGDLLAVMAAFVWSCYSVLVKKVSSFGYHAVQSTRRIFAYGLVFMIPALFLFGFRPDLSLFIRPAALLPLLYLGLGASALCFVTWTAAVKYLGAVRTSVYIYMVPVITIAASALILHEPVTPYLLFGTALTLAGLFLSELK